MRISDWSSDVCSSDLQAAARYREAVDGGLLKIMSKMGISVISSYRGGYNFEALGLSRALVADLFPGMPSRISGMGLLGIQTTVLGLHEKAFRSDILELPVGGIYRSEERRLGKECGRTCRYWW